MKYIRISKKEAKKRCENGVATYATPVKMNPNSEIMPPFELRSNLSETGETWDQYVNMLTYYNCNYETGYYLAYYIDEKEGD